MLEKQLEAAVHYSDPIHQIQTKEFNLALIKFGSYVSIIQNKRLSQTFILLQLLESEKLREIFKGICEVDNFQVLLLQLLECYPALCKSKIIKSKIQQLFNPKSKSKRDRLRKIRL